METNAWLQRAAADAATSAGVAFVDGKYVPLDDATISVRDFGFIRSDVTYDAVHVWEGQFFRLDRHLDRFLSSASKLRLTVPYDKAQLREILGGCVRQARLRHALVTMLCTRGRPQPGSRDIRQCQNRFIGYAAPFLWIANPTQQMKGMSVIISSTRRIPPESVDPTAKNYHWLDLERSQFEAYDRGADNAILLDFRGNVTEGVGFNVFAVFGKRLVTPDHGALEGITRQTVIDIARRNGIPLEVRPIAADEFRRADELFAVSTAGGVMPIVKIDDATVGNGAPRALTMQIRDWYWEMHTDPAECTPIDYDP